MSGYIFSGSHRFRRYDTTVDGQQFWLPKLLCQYLVELLCAAMASENNDAIPEEEKGWLRNIDSFSCGFLKDGKTPARDPDERARGFNNDLKNLFGVVTEAGGKRYRLRRPYSPPQFNAFLFTQPTLDRHVLNRLAKVLEVNG